MSDLSKLGNDLGKSIEGAFERFKGALERGEIVVPCNCNHPKHNWKWIGISLALHTVLFSGFLLLKVLVESHYPTPSSLQQLEKVEQFPLNHK